MAPLPTLTITHEERPGTWTFRDPEGTALFVFDPGPCLLLNKVDGSITNVMWLVDAVNIVHRLGYTLQ